MANERTIGPESPKRYAMMRSLAGTGALVIAALSATLLLTLWIRSASIVDYFLARQWSIDSVRGRLTFVFCTPPVQGGSGPFNGNYGYGNRRFAFTADGDTQPGRTIAGFGYATWRSSAPARTHWRKTVPYYSLLVIACLPLATALWRAFTLTRVFGNGVCIYCGYDLRASPSRCPECGATARQLGRRPR